LEALGGQLDRQRSTTAAWIASGITERSPLRADLSHDDAVDIIWLLIDPVVFRRLTRDRRWSIDAFQLWFADTVHRLLLPPAAPPMRKDTSDDREARR
jgi:hypothetical protein